MTTVNTNGLRHIGWIYLSISKLANSFDANVSTNKPIIIIRTQHILMSPLTQSDLSQLDTRIANLVRHSLLISTRTPRALPFAARTALGLGFATACTSALIATQRELLITLSRADYEGRLARLTYKDTCADPTTSPEALLHRNITKLARFGIYVHSADELLLARALSAMRRHNPLLATTPNLTARFDEVRSTCTAHANYSVLSKLATQLRNALQPTSSLQRNQRVASALRDAITSARTAAANDWTHTCTSYGLPHPCHCPEEELSYDDSCPTADKRFLLLFRQHSPESREFLQQWSSAPRLNCVVATDGGDLGASCIVVLPADTTGATIDPMDCPVVPRIIFSKKLTEAARLGNTPTTCFETEFRGAFTDVHLRQFVALGPSVLDNQSVLDFVSSPIALDIRTLVAQGRSALHRPMQVAKTLMRDSDHLDVLLTLDRAQLNCALERRFYSDIPLHQRPLRNPVQVFAPRPELHCYVKIKSHQTLPLPPEGPSPCYLMYHANAAADTAATAGTEDARLNPVPPISIPPFRGPFFILHKEEMVTGKLSQYIKLQLHADCDTNLRDTVARREFALIPCCSEHIHPTAQNLLMHSTGRVPFFPVAEELVDNHTSIFMTNAQSMALSHALQLGPSWHNILRESRNPLSFPTDPEELDDGATPLADCCPFCLPLRRLGNSHHYRSLECSNAEVKAAVHHVYAETEKCLLSYAPLHLWAQFSKSPPPARDEQINIELTTTYPILSRTGWLLRTNLADPELSLAEVLQNLHCTTWHLGMLGCSVPKTLCYHNRPAGLDPEQVLWIELVKNTALTALRLKVNALLREAAKSLSVENEPADSPCSSTTESKHCSYPECIRRGPIAAHGLCKFHKSRQQAYALASSLARTLPRALSEIRAFGLLTATNIRSAFLSPSATGGCFGAIVTQHAAALKSSSNTTESVLWAHSSTTVPLALLHQTLTLLHIPFICPKTPDTVTWDMPIQVQANCRCPGSPSKRLSASLGKATLFICRDCRRPRLLTAATTTDTSTCTACLCTLDTSEPHQTCLLCSLRVHSGPQCSSGIAWNKPTRQPPVDWVCPPCRLTLALFYSQPLPPDRGLPVLTLHLLPTTKKRSRRDRATAQGISTLLAVPRICTAPSPATPTPLPPIPPPPPPSAPPSAAAPLSTIAPSRKRPRRPQPLDPPAQTTLPDRPALSTRGTFLPANLLLHGSLSPPVPSPSAMRFLSRLATRDPEEIIARLSMTEPITISLLQRLTQPTTWLCNVAIDAAANLILQDTLTSTARLRCYYFKCAVYTSLANPALTNVPRLHSLAAAGISIFDKDLLFFPVNHSNAHWALIVISIADKEIIYLDSLRRANSPRALAATHLAWNYIAAEAVRLSLPPILPSQWKCVDGQQFAPQQRNGHDCGMFVIQYMRQLSLRAPLLHILQEHMPAHRCVLAAALAQRQLISIALPASTALNGLISLTQDSLDVSPPSRSKTTETSLH